MRQSGGKGQYGHVVLKIEPNEPGKGVEFVDAIKGGVVPREFIPAVEKGITEAVTQGVLAGYPVVDVKVTLHFGSYHDVDSSEMAFKTAARIAMVDGMPGCSPVLLEPIHDVQIFVPSDFTSKIQRAVTQRRAQILASHAYALKLAGRAVEAEAPIRASLALEESLYGSDSEALTSGLSKLVSILRDQRRYADAAAVADRAVAIRRATLPPRHPALLFGIQNAARVWLQAGDLARARALIDEALAGYQANGSSDTSAGVSARLIHVEALVKEGNLDDARAVLAAVEPLTSVMGATDKALSERLRAKLMGSNEPRSGR